MTDRAQMPDPKALASLYKAVSTLKNAKEAAQFFADLCTPAELQAMSDRWRVVAPLKAGVAYRQIYEDTGVSVTTIGRVSRCLSLGTGGYNLVFDRIERQNGSKKNKNRDSKKR